VAPSVIDNVERFTSAPAVPTEQYINGIVNAAVAANTAYPAVPVATAALDASGKLDGVTTPATAAFMVIGPQLASSVPVTAADPLAGIGPENTAINSKAGEAMFIIWFANSVDTFMTAPMST
jgi:hypothetical protein